MEFGWWSIIPPIIAIGLALLTKEVISSLIIGILSGALIFSHWNIVGAVSTTFDIMATKMGDNAGILVFLALLGALVVVVTMAGGSRAYGDWAIRKIKNRSGAKLATSFLGILIFIDDYFNCLTIGTVMRPVTDKHNISRAKLAYIIDSTAAPICMIAPVSSWAAAFVATIADAGVENGLTTFMSTIPFNLYAILTIIMVIFMCFTKRDFGPMEKFEHNAKENGDVFSNTDDVTEGNIEEVEISPHGKVIDLVIPIVALIIFTIASMLYTGGFFDGGISIADAIGDSAVNLSLMMGGFGGLVVAFVMFVPRKLMTFKGFMGGITKGVKSMVPAFIILTLAWTISGICRDGYLDTGSFVGTMIANSNMPLMILPAIIFVVAGALAFATGTSWGTFGILIPILVTTLNKTNSPEMLTLVLAATFAGAVFGDHCSPISDTTILSSTGAGCNHIDHVSSQMPYAGLVAGFCFIGYIIAGFTANVYITLGVSIALLLIALFILTRPKTKSAKS